MILAAEDLQAKLAGPKADRPFVFEIGGPSSGSYGAGPASYQDRHIAGAMFSEGIFEDDSGDWSRPSDPTRFAEQLGAMGLTSTNDKIVLYVLLRLRLSFLSCPSLLFHNWRTNPHTAGTILSTPSPNHPL